MAPGSLRSRTVVLRTSDHGEMGLSHGALRQKAFNAYEETINVPLVISNPTLFPEPAETDALASLVDVVPTVIALAGGAPADDLRGRDLSPILAEAANPERERAAEGTDSPLRILEVAPVWVPVPPEGYGGIEWVVHWLVEGLRERGVVDVGAGPAEQVAVEDEDAHERVQSTRRNPCYGSPR